MRTIVSQTQILPLDNSHPLVNRQVRRPQQPPQRQTQNTTVLSQTKTPSAKAYLIGAVVGCLLTALVIPRIFPGESAPRRLARKRIQKPEITTVLTQPTTTPATAARPIISTVQTPSATERPLVADSNDPRLNPTADYSRAVSLAHGRAGCNQVLFTFDDGPDLRVTPRIMQVLADHHVRGVFFMLGERLAGSQQHRVQVNQLVEGMLAQGHTIGNHTWSHAHLPALTSAEAASEIDRTNQIIEEITGQQPLLFRPPYGEFSRGVQQHVMATGNEVWLWSIDPRDYARPSRPHAVAQSVIRSLRRDHGGTVLMHDIHGHTPEALDEVLTWIESYNREHSNDAQAQLHVVDANTFLATIRNGCRTSTPAVTSVPAGHTPANHRL